MALRMTWHPEAGGADDAVTVYWVRPEGDWRTGYVARALGVTRLWRESVGLDATEDELTSWSAAAMECVDALRAAGADFWPAQLRRSRWRDWPLARRWAQAGYDRVVERVGDVAAWWAGVRAGAVPLGHLLAGTWHLDLYLPDQVLFVASSAHRDYHFAIESTEHVGYSTYTRKVWWQRDSADFVRSLFPVSATYTETYGSQSLRFPIADHADPAAYGPYVEAVAAHVAAAVRALLPDRRPP
jgi:hypothetical protein